VSYASASRTFAHPMILLKQQRNNFPLKAAVPSRSLAEVSENGFIISEFFVKWLNHFVKHVKQTTEKKKSTPFLNWTYYAFK
jgi:hypothetical protein